MTTAAVPGIGPVSLIFKLNNGLVARSFDDLSDEEAWQRPGNGNPMAWVLGHITHTRTKLLATLDHPWDAGLGPMFRRGSALQEPSAYPSRQTIEEAWNATHARMRDAFAGLTEARLASAAGGPPLPGVTTVADLIGFLAFHESYHVGQLSYIRRLIGRSAVAG